MIQDTFQTITSSAKRFFSGTLLSRFTGLGREVLMAAAFGTLPAVAAFWMAFRFAHLLRRLFGEGGLHVAFIPHFESLRQKDPRQGALFFHQLSIGITALLLFLVVIGEGILGGFLVWGILEEGTCQVLRLTMILLPAVIFISLYALNQSLLHCERSYFLPSVAPALLNLIWIAAVFWLWKKPAEEAMEKLAMIIVFAFAGQWFVTVPKVYHYLSNGLGPRWWERKEAFGKEIFSLLRPFFLGLIGVTATQINSALDTIFARLANPEGPAILWYALRLQQLPLALLGVGLTGALLPPISRAIQSGDPQTYLHFLGFALKRCIALMVPITFGLFVLGFSGVNMVYGHGQFSAQATLETTLCLWAYGAGLLPMTLVLILASAFYAKKNYRVPTFFSVLSVLVNIGLNAFFVFGWGMGAISIAVATSLSAALNCFLLVGALTRKESISIVPLFTAFIKVTLCALLAAVATLLIGSTVLQDQLLDFLLGVTLTPFSRSFSSQFVIFCSQTLCFGGLLFLFAFLFKVDVLTELIPKRILKIRTR